MGKGISTVIATLLMLIITIALVGFSYTFISGTFTGKVSTAFSVIDSYKDTITISNIGTDPITSFRSVTVDGSPANYLVTSQDNSLVGYWKLDENSGTTASDSSVNGNTGTLSGSGNLVNNSGFENGATGWTLWTGATVSSEKSHSGVSSLKITGAQQQNYQIVNVNPSTTYTIAAWVYVDYTPPAGLRIDAQELPAGPIDVNQVFTSVTGKWVFLSKTFTTGSTTNQIKVRLINDKAGSVGNGYFDDVQLSVGPVWGEGRFGNALYFDGSNDYVEIGDVDVSTELTIDAWIYFGSAGGMGIVHKWVGPSAYVLEDNPPRITTQTNVGYATCAIPGATLTLNTWYHIVGVYSSSTNQLKIFQNGDLKNTCSQSGTINNNPPPLRIGARSDFLSQFFNGIIDDIKIYNRALSDQEVKASYNIGSQINPGSTATIKIYNQVSKGTHTVRLCTSSMCNTAILTIV